MTMALVIINVICEAYTLSHTRNYGDLVVTLKNCFTLTNLWSCIGLYLVSFSFYYHLKHFFSWGCTCENCAKLRPRQSRLHAECFTIFQDNLTKKGLVNDSDVSFAPVKLSLLSSLFICLLHQMDVPGGVPCIPGYGENHRNIHNQTDGDNEDDRALPRLLRPSCAMKSHTGDSNVVRFIICSHC